MFEKEIEAFKDCTSCEWYDTVNLNGCCIPICNSFKNPATCNKKEITHDE